MKKTVVVVRRVSLETWEVDGDLIGLGDDAIWQKLDRAAEFTHGPKVETEGTEVVSVALKEA